MMFRDIDMLNENIDEPEEIRSVYIILYREGQALNARLNRICETFGQNRFEIPANFEEKEAELTREITELNNVFSITRSEILRALTNIFRPIEGFTISRLEFQKFYLAKEKLLYQKMNMLRLENSLLQGICWCPADEIQNLQAKLTKIQQNNSGLVVKLTRIENRGLVPPTYLRVNEFTWAFQEIVTTYGIPRYREVNPAFFTIVSFPFLFGVMFGDICHGLFLLGLSLYLCIFKDNLIKSKSIVVPLIKARYIFMVMGIFASFCGLIYNDFAGLNFNFFKSCFSEIKVNGNYHVNKENNCVYPVGIDPYWKYSSKQMQFENSLKMKLSVILGVIQMLIGVVMKLVNAIEFKKNYDIYFEFIPQFLFLFGLFGFMDFLIFVKWLTDYENNTAKAPYVITIIINMFLNFGNPGSDKTLIPSQQLISIILLVLIFICIPTMLLPKPFFVMKDYKAIKDKQNLATTQDSQEYFINNT